MKYIIILFISIALIGCSQDQNQFSIKRGNYQRTGNYVTDPITRINKVLWEANPGKRTFDTNPILYDKKIFIGDNRGDIHVLESETGKELATSNIDYGFHRSASFLGQQLQINEGVLYFNIVGDITTYLCAVDVNTLQLKWKKELNLPYTPVIYGDKIYYSLSNELVSANKNDGKRVWSIKVGANKNDFITSDLCMSEGTIFLGTDQKIHYAIDAKDGKILWKEKLSGKEFPVSKVYYLRDESESVIGGQNLLIYDSGSIISLDTKSGKENWRGSYNCNSLAAVSENKIVFNKENAIDCISLSNGKLIWEYSKKYFYPHTSPIIVGSNIYLSYEGDMGTGAFKCIDLNTGNENWDYKPGAGSYISPLVYDKKMYLALSYKLIALE